MDTSEIEIVSNTPKRASYYDKFKTRAYTLITLLEFTIIFALGFLFEITGITHLGWIYFSLTSLIVSSLVSGLTVLALKHILAPFRDLLQAVIVASGESTKVKPPNPAKYASRKDGFKEIIQTVFDLSLKDIQEDKDPVLSDDIQTGLNNTSTGIIILDHDKNVIYHNSVAPIKRDIDNKPVVDLIFPDYDTLDNWLDKVATNKVRDEKRWRRLSDRLPGDKERRMFDVIANYQKNSSAETVITLIEETSKYQPEEDELDFIAFAAHELRGPITVIRGYIDVINDELHDQFAPDQAELMQRLLVASNRLSSYVNNILNASRYDRKHLKLHLQEETINSIYDIVSDDMQMRARAQNRVLAVDIPSQLPTVAADPNAVSEVFSNLIDNAIKYSNEGGLVHVTAKAIPGFVEISVSDRGIGMPSNVLPNLFHKFYRSHRSRETVSGTGIGLYICKAIVSSCGGTVSARSVENEGSTFTFTLPIYDSVATKLDSDDMHNNVSLISHGGGWINNHSMRRN